MAHSVIEAFIKKAPGKKYDVDKSYGYQCKDLIDAFVMEIFPGTSWIETITPGNANQVFATASSAYFTKVKNDWNKLNQLPPRGSIICFAGDSFNTAGHIAIVTSADKNSVAVIEQDGFKQGATAANRWGYDNYGTGAIQGWLIPKDSKMPKQSVREKVASRLAPNKQSGYNLWRYYGREAKDAWFYLRDIHAMLVAICKHLKINHEKVK